MLVHELILERVGVHGDRTALSRGDAHLTYSEMAGEIRSVANGLASLGIAPGERIAIYMSKRIEGVVSFFGANLAGAVFVPINHLLKPAQVKHIVENCGVSVFLTTSVQAKALKSTLAGCCSLRHIIAVDDDGWKDLTKHGGVDVVHHRRIDNDPAAIFYTSGSTGLPNGVVLSNRNMVMGAISVASYLKNNSDDVILSVLPLSFDAGFSQLTTAFSVGAKVVLLDYLVPHEVPKAIARHHATGLGGVPSLWNQLAKISWPQGAADSLRYVTNTGGAMPTTTLSALRKLLPQTTVFLMYGLTESFRSTYLPPEELDRRPTSIGKAIPNAEVLVVREDGSLCDPDEPGELVHRGALVSLGYWNEPERTALRFRPVPNHPGELPLDEIAVWSGDTVVKDEDGFLYFIGRKDDMIKSSGFRISPTELEEVVYATGLVNECVALGIPDNELGQAVVVAAQSSTPDNDTYDSIIRSCKRALPSFMVPSKIVWRDSLPRNPNGKIDRCSLKNEFQDLFLGDGD